MGSQSRTRLKRLAAAAAYLRFLTTYLVFNAIKLLYLNVSCYIGDSKFVGSRLSLQLSIQCQTINIPNVYTEISFSFFLCSESSWLHRLFKIVASKHMLLSNCHLQASHCRGFSLQWLLLFWNTDSRRLQSSGFSSCGTWAQ